MTDELRILTTATVFAQDPLPHMKGDAGITVTLGCGTVATVVADQLHGGLVLHMRTRRGHVEAVHVRLSPLLEAVLARATSPTAALRSPMPSVLAPSLPTLEKPTYQL